MKCSDDSSVFPPDIDITRTSIAYGDRALPRMNRELRDERTIVRQRTLMCLCDYLKDPEHIVTAIKQGTVDILKHLLSDSDRVVRQKTVECLYIMSSHAVGREAFIEFQVIPTLTSLLDDYDKFVRKFVHLTFTCMAQSPETAMSMVQEHSLSLLILKLKQEDDETVEQILDTLHECFKVDVQRALSCGAMAVMVELLTHCLPSIRYRAARAVMSLAVTAQGKEQAIEDKSVRELVPMLTDDYDEVRAYTAGALMRITVTTKGKYTALKCEAIEPLVNLLVPPAAALSSSAIETNNATVNSSRVLLYGEAAAMSSSSGGSQGGEFSAESIAIAKGLIQEMNEQLQPKLPTLPEPCSDQTKINVLKTITCLAEAPEGRAQLLKFEDVIRAAWGDPMPAVSAAAEKALKVILWKP